MTNDILNKVPFKRKTWMFADYGFNYFQEGQMY